MKYEDFDYDFKNKDLSRNYDHVMQTKNIRAGLWYLLQRASTIREGDVIAMIISELKEREILYKALEHYAAMGKPEDYIIDNMPTICEIEDVLYLPEFNLKNT